MKPNLARILPFCVILTLILAGCGANVTPSPTSLPPATAAPSLVPSATAAPLPSATPTAVITPTLPPTPTLSPTPTLVPSPTPTVSTLLAAREALTAANARNLKVQALWGLGAIHSQVSLQQGKLVLAETTLGLYLYDFAALKLIQFFPEATSPYFSQDEAWMAYLDGSGIKIYDLDNLKAHQAPAGGGAMTAAAFSPDDKLLAVVHSSTNIDVIRMDDLSAVNLTRDRTSTYEPETYKTVFSPDGQFLLTQENGGLVLWIVAEKKLVWYMNNFSQAIPDRPFSPDGSFFLTQDNKGSTLRDTRFGTELFSLLGWASGSPYSPDGKYFFLLNKTVATVYTLNHYPGVVRTLFVQGAGPTYFSGDSSTFFAGDNVLKLADNTVKVVKSEAQQNAQIDPAQALKLGHFNNLKGFATGEEGQLWVWGVLDRQMFLWETVSGQLQMVEISGKSFYANVAYHAASQRFFACTDKGLEVINMKDGTRQLFTACLPGAQVAISPDGTMIARAALTRIELLNAGDGSAIHTMPEHTNDINHLVFSADGKWLAVGTVKNMQNGYCEVSLWSLAPFQLVSGFRGKQIPGGVNDLAVTVVGGHDQHAPAVAHRRRRADEIRRYVWNFADAVARRQAGGGRRLQFAFAGDCSGF